QRKFAELPSFAFDGYPPVTLLDNSITDAQSQSHSFAYILGGEKRIEELVQILSFDAFAIIANAQRGDALVLTACNPDRRFFAFECFLSIQSIDRVLQQIDHHLNELV